MNGNGIYLKLKIFAIWLYVIHIQKVKILKFNKNILLALQLFTKQLLIYGL